jgi:uncharacterized membrane protein/thiol-disulfide isomerase/thioredoxin
MANILVSIIFLFAWLNPDLKPVASFVLPDGVVRAVLFYSPTCGHCHFVITETLPPLLEKYGNKLYIIGVDVTSIGGQALFQSAMEKYSLESSGVPMLVVGDTVLIGSLDIPEKFPGLIEQYLAQGGVDWPDIPGLGEAIATAQPTQVTVDTPPAVETSPALVPAAVAPATTTAAPDRGLALAGEQVSGFGVTFARDPLGNSLAILVLCMMLGSLGMAAFSFWHAPRTKLSRPRDYAVPILCLIGLCVAGYLAYVETSQSTAVCGPIGDCNSVQQSAYARLFGVLPIGIIGLVGYGMILLAWATGHFLHGKLSDYTSITLVGLTTFGTLFSIYLTFLEPFVIGATCIWCLSSAILMTALLLLSIPPGRLGILNLCRKNDRVITHGSVKT